MMVFFGKSIQHIEKLWVLDVYSAPQQVLQKGSQESVMGSTLVNQEAIGKVDST